MASKMDENVNAGRICKFLVAVEGGWSTKYYIECYIPKVRHTQTFMKLVDAGVGQDIQDCRKIAAKIKARDIGK